MAQMGLNKFFKQVYINLYPFSKGNNVEEKRKHLCKLMSRSEMIRTCY